MVYDPREVKRYIEARRRDAQPPPPKEKPKPQSPVVTIVKRRLPPKKAEIIKDIVSPQPQTPQSVIVETKIRDVSYRKQAGQQLQQIRGIEQTIDPTATYVYEGEQISGVRAKEILSEQKENIVTGMKESVQSRKLITSEVETYHPETKFYKRGDQYLIVPPSTTTFQKEKYEELDTGEKRIAEFFAPLTSSMKGIVNPFGLTGIGADKQVTIEGKTYIKYGSTVGTLYRDPFTGKSYFKHGDKLSEYTGSPSVIGDVSPTVPTYGEKYIGMIPLFPDMSKERLQWMREIQKESPIGSRISMGAGEGFSFGVWSKLFIPSAIKGGKYLFKGTTTSKPFTIGTARLTSGYSVMKNIIRPYTPSFIQRSYSSLFAPYKPGGGTLYMRPPSGGIVSTYVARSPLRYGLPGKWTPDWLTGASQTSSRLSAIRTDKMYYQIFDATKTTPFKRSLWGIPKLTESGNIVFGRSGSWRFVGSNAAKNLLQPGQSTVSVVGGMTDDTFLLQFQKSSLSKPYGLFKGKMDLTQRGILVGGTKLEFPIPQPIFPTISTPWRYAIPKTITPSIEGEWESFVKQQPQPFTGKPIQVVQPGGFKKVYLTQSEYKFLKKLDELEPVYKTQVYPPNVSQPKISITQQSLWKGVKPDVFIGTIQPFKYKPFKTNIYDWEKLTKRDFKQDVFSKSDFDTKFARISLSGSIVGLDTSLGIGSMSMSGLKLDIQQKQLFKQPTITKITVPQITKPFKKVKIPKIPFWYPSGNLGGRGRMFYGEDYWGKKYKFREFKVPSIQKLLKKVF